MPLQKALTAQHESCINSKTYSAFPCLFQKTVVQRTIFIWSSRCHAEHLELPVTTPAPAKSPQKKYIAAASAKKIVLQLQMTTPPMVNTNNGIKKSPALCTGLSAFFSLLYFFFLPGFLCAELFFLVGLFFLGWAVFFDIQLNLSLVNYLLVAAEYFFPFFQVVPLEAATVQSDNK